MIFLAPAAEKDIDEVITYLAQENPATAHTFLDSLMDAMEKLSDHPDIGHLRVALFNYLQTDSTN
jgi:plasmid stabilization system protein ParE